MMVPAKRLSSQLLLAFALLMLPFSGGAAGATGWEPSRLAAGSYRSNGALCFRVDLAKGWPVLARTSLALPQPRDRLHPAYRGEVVPLVRIVFAEGEAPQPRVERRAWDHQRAAYRLGDGAASLTFGRLSPAVLVESPGRRLAFRGPLRFIAWPRGGGVVVRRLDALTPQEAQHPAIDEPWLLAWFGSATPIRGAAFPADVADKSGVSKPKLASAANEPLDLPLLFRLEHRPAALRREGDELALVFPQRVGKVAAMPVLGGRVVLAAESEKWANGLPNEVLAACRLWARLLRDYPLAVEETFEATPDAVEVTERFSWVSFADDWRTPPRKAAPLPPMLALALGGGVPVSFARAGRAVRPADCRFMDTFGKAMVIEGADAYRWRLAGLGEWLDFKRPARGLPPEAEPVRRKLERRVRETVEAGHLAPLLYVYGGIGGTRFAHYYWVGTPELAHALAMAYPYLSAELQKKVVAYLRSEWRAFPPFHIDERCYKTGLWRAPYRLPWEDIGRNAWLPLSRDMDYRRNSFFFDLYRVWEYLELTGDTPDPDKLRSAALGLVQPFLKHQDWAIMGPARLKTVSDRHRLRYFTAQGQATYNQWAAGALGLVRLARRFGWKDLEGVGTYLFARLALARVAQARYVAQMHAMGLARAAAADDWRTLLHVDTTCAIVGWGPLASGVHQNQELPPFIDVVEEVGRLLGRYARPECKTYLDYLDYAIPFWYISEAPKQGATEHRTCPLQHYNGNVLAQYWVLGRRGRDFLRYVDTSRFRGDLYLVQNLAAALESFATP